MAGKIAGIKEFLSKLGLELLSLGHRKKEGVERCARVRG